MQLPKASDDAKALFAEVVPDDPRVVVKPMFGNLGAFVNGNMFAGLFGDRIGVRVLDDARRAELAATDGAGPFGPEERPMGGYVAAPAAWSGEPERIAGWVARAFEEVQALPPKAPKAGARPRSARRAEPSWAPRAPRLSRRGTPAPPSPRCGRRCRSRPRRARRPIRT